MKTFRVLLSWIAVFFLLMVCANHINPWITKHLTNFDFNSIGVKLLYVFMVVSGFILLITKSKTKNFNYLINSICICALYAIFRFHMVQHDGWDFATLFGCLKYTDAIGLIPLISLKPYWTVALKQKNQKNYNTTQNIISGDSAIEVDKDDLLGYSNDAKNLLSTIVKNRSRAEKGAIVIGLTGEWGQGKTSYLNLMRNAAKEYHNIIVIRINVWQSHNYNDMVQKLLYAIANGINDLSLRNMIHDYTKAIIDADISYLSKIAALLFGKKSKQPETLFDSVGERINELGKTILVQVDDLDRLTSEEILYTLKLIRNIAGFKNVFFIVAYDDAYIKEQLSKLNIPTSYLDKIFNIIYPLPSLRKDAYIELVKKTLTNSLLIDADIETVVDKFMDVIDNNLSLRNAKRLANSIQCGISNLTDEDGDIMIDLLDFILVQYLNQINPDAYKFLANFLDDKTFFIKEKCLTLSGSFYTINTTKDFFPKKTELTEDEYIKDRLIRDIGENDAPVVQLTYKIFQVLFNNGRNTILGLAYVNSYPLYFNRTFDKALITKKEFRNSIQSGKDFFKNDLRRWYNNNDRVVLNHLINKYQCESLDAWLQFFESILCIIPGSFTAFLWHQQEKKWFIPTFGLSVINNSTPEAKERKEIFYRSIYTFFFKPETLGVDSIETLQKKLALLILNKNIYTENITSFTGESAVSDKDIFELYWSQYLSKGGSYKNFDEDFWYFINECFGQEKLDLRKIAQEHIATNIEDFIKHYSISKIISNPDLHSLFSEYIVTGSNSAQRNSIWKPHFRDFLISIDKKSPALLKYIEDLGQHMSSTCKD